MLAMAAQPLGEIAFQMSDKEPTFAAPSNAKTGQEAEHTANGNEWYDKEYHARPGAYPGTRLRLG